MINSRSCFSPKFTITIGDTPSTNLPSPEKLGGAEFLQGRVELPDGMTGVSCVEDFTRELSIDWPSLVLSKVSSETQP